MAEEVLSDALVNDLSKQINIKLYPVSDFAVDLGFDFVAASAAEELAIHKQCPQGKYEHLLQKFVATHGRSVEGAQDLIDIFKLNEKKDLVNFFEEAIKKQKAVIQSGRRQEPGPAKGQGQTWTGASARNKWKFVAGLSCLVVALLAIVAACNNLIPEPGKCAKSLCRNGGTCHELHGEYSCTCKSGYGGNNCETEYIAETLSLEELQDTLRSHYEKNIFKIPIKPWDRYEDVDLKKYYTTVSLYKEDKNKIPDKPLQKSILNGSVNDIFRTKVNGSLPERIVLFGEAGRGKTTAVAKMAYDWANKNGASPLKNVKLLFVFKMRNMNAKTGITEAIVPLLGKKYEKYIKELEEYIDSHEKDIVMLFDGYDEFSGELNCRDNISYVIDILCEERCRQCRVLVTSRPVRKKDFYSRSFYYSKMVIEGYSQQHATDFIDKFFPPNETKATELKKYLEEDIVTNEMIATPLFCTMVCYLWKDGYFHGKSTRTKLFDDIMDLLRKHLNAKHERDKDIEQDLLNSTLVSVGQVALKKMMSTKDPNPLVFSEEDFSEVHDDILNISYSLGLLTKNIKTDNNIIIHIEFFHKLAQEYSAGRYLASELENGSIYNIVLHEAFSLQEIVQFASGTSVLACRIILESLIDHCSSYECLYHPLILDVISETGTCADDSATYLARFFEDGKLQLRQV
ncbi:NLR family CARD domain-containing protein 4-like [Strongylocentrotus purpuratus]|uniref:NACHT domain-containing protein n=1 Tax=Strongylocentrotus purpuratus TaxID=7668 RepID=A0A7M7NUU2_STRPU|nr:NLR family CARD domain-containing protein 4-like [Strongylocentrotus purpuratus]